MGHLSIRRADRPSPGRPPAALSAVSGRRGLCSGASATRPGHRSCPPLRTPRAAVAACSPSPSALLRSLQARCDDCPGPRGAVRAARAAAAGPRSQGDR
ncbi:hypothetical protein [Streptomyces huasconensis]|uniref:hypothetical protein n=1 Tax=Streptomyces huasconensis TaxID=1854574 RepID=UPI0033FE2B20